MKLTKLESEILIHRLEVPDSIIDALTDEKDVAEDCVDAITGSCSRLLDHITAKGEIPSELSQVDKDVLLDCVDGSTYLGCVLTEASKQKQAAIYRAGCCLADKIRELTGVEVAFPSY